MGQRILMLELSQLGRPLDDWAEMRGRGGRTLPCSDQTEGSAYPEAVSEALQLCVAASLGQAVEQGL